jgi:hypothetical protein
MSAGVGTERRVRPGDLVTDRFGHGVILVQNLYMPGSRNTRLKVGDVVLVTWVGIVKEALSGVNRDVCDVLFKGDVWRTNTSSLRVVSDG